MNKQQAYEQATKESLASSSSETMNDVINRSMDIYARGFAAFLQRNKWLPLGIQSMWYRNFNIPNYETKSTDELIIEFEK